MRMRMKMKMRETKRDIPKVRKKDPKEKMTQKEIIRLIKKRMNVCIPQGQRFSHQMQYSLPPLSADRSAVITFLLVFVFHLHLPRRRAQQETVLVVQAQAVPACRLLEAAACVRRRARAHH